MYSSINPIVRFLFFMYIGTSFAAIPIFVLAFLYKLIVKIKIYWWVKNMKRNVYDVYDLNGTKLISEKTASEIAVALCVSANTVTKCCCEHRVLAGKYCVEKVAEVSKKPDNAVKNMIINEWEKAIAPFKNVEWVKSISPGVKRLAVK